MSRRIERSEQVHLNVKCQDGWQLKQHFTDPEAGTLVLSMNPHNPECGPQGRLYLNGISREKLEELRSEIDLFLKRRVARP